MIRATTQMKKETILKTLAVIVLPGGIPIFLGYQAYKLYKKGRDKYKKESKDERHKTKSDGEHTG